MDRKMNAEEAGLHQKAHRKTSWNTVRRQYTCGDGTRIKVPRRTADIRDLDETKTVPSSGVTYARDSLEEFQPRIAVSGVEFDRSMRMLFGGSDGIRTIIFPSMLRTV